MPRGCAKGVDGSVEASTVESGCTMATSSKAVADYGVVKTSCD